MSVQAVSFIPYNISYLKEIAENIIIEIEYEDTFDCYTAGIFNANLARDNKFVSSTAPTRFRFGRYVEETHREIHFNKGIFDLYLTVIFDKDDNKACYLQVRCSDTSLGKDIRNEIIFKARLLRKKDEVFEIEPYVRAYKSETTAETFVTSMCNITPITSNLREKKICFYMSIFEYQDTDIGDMHMLQAISNKSLYFADVLFGEISVGQKYTMRSNKEYKDIFKKKSDFSGPLFTTDVYEYVIDGPNPKGRSYLLNNITIGGQMYALMTRVDKTGHLTMDYRGLLSEELPA